ncbi:MAG: hypothetical protein MJZ02_01485 [Paludibacteraceae bacterium]|nr:hypothetical protein [Paludibacteraceae bacterium]
MKKILPFIFAISAILFSSCSKDTDSTYSYTYVTVGGTWQMHVTAHDGVSDSVIYSPQRMVNMTWSDMTYDSIKNQTTIHSQVTIGNGVWRLFSVISGEGVGSHAMLDSSYATYTFTTKPNSHDSLTVVKYALTGTVNWVNSTQRYGNLSIDAKATNIAGETVSFSGIVKSALAIDENKNNKDDEENKDGDEEEEDDDDDNIIWLN